MFSLNTILLKLEVLVIPVIKLFSTFPFSSNEKRAYEKEKNNILRVIAIQQPKQINILADFYKTSIDYIVGRTDVKEPYPKRK